MAKRGKLYKKAQEQIDKTKAYSVEEAISLVKSTATKKFDESIDAVFHLAVDTRKSDQAIRGTVSLPNGTGKTARVVVFASGDKAEEAKAAGADEVGAEDLIEKVEKGFLDFDFAVATPMMMPKMAKLGRVLGPRGLMPNPKTNTVTMNIGQVVKEIKAGKIEFRADKNGNLAFSFGKASFDEKQLLENFNAVASEVKRLKPTTLKGQYLMKASISSTMGPGITLDNSSVF